MVDAFSQLGTQKGEIVSDKADSTAKASKPSGETGHEPTDLIDQAPPEGLRALALDYPIALVAGGIVAGVLIGALLPRARHSRLSKGAVALASVASEAGLSYARKALANRSEAAQASGRVAEAVGERAGAVLHSVGDSAADYSGKAVDTAETAATALRSSAEGLARQVIRLTSQLRH